MIEGARKNLRSNRERIVFVKDGQEFLPGIQAMAAPGHTVGHTAYMITSQGKTLCLPAISPSITFFRWKSRGSRSSSIPTPSKP